MTPDNAPVRSGGEAESRYELRPSTVGAALRWVRAHHRHLPELQGGLFSVADAQGDEQIGVAVAGNPCQVWQGTGRIYITRCAAREDASDVIDSSGDTHASPACTMLYGAICRAAKALGYRETYTYTLPHEPGKSLRAAGFVDDGLTAGGEHDRPSRPRSKAKHPEPKRRWKRDLYAGTPPTAPGTRPRAKPER